MRESWQQNKKPDPRTRDIDWPADKLMKPLPPPRVPGNTESERFDNAVRKMFTVSKKAILKEEAKWKRARERKKRAKKAT